MSVSCVYTQGGGARQLASVSPRAKGGLLFDTDRLNFVYRFLECPVQHPPRNSCGAKQMFVLRELPS